MSDAVVGQRSPRWAVWSRLLIPDRMHPEQVYLARLRIVQTPWFALFVHRIHTPDGDRDPHDHPWPFLSFVARGGYTEEVFSHMRGKRPAGMRKRVRGRFSLHRMPMHAAHRITTVKPGTVTVILTGRRKHTWGFYTPQGFMTWQQYEAAELTVRLYPDCPGGPMTANEDLVSKWRSRWRCHRSLLCCQYVDDPNCNGGSHERHRWVRAWNWFRAMMAGF